MIYVLDSDHLSVLERGGSAAIKLELRLDAVAPDEVVTTIVTYEEQMRGWLANSARSRSVEQLLRSYARLQDHVSTFSAIRVLPFDERAAERIALLFAKRINVGTMDRRIASIVLANDATLLTRNVADFRNIPNMRIEDWTV